MRENFSLQLGPTVHHIHGTARQISHLWWTYGPSYTRNSKTNFTFVQKTSIGHGITEYRCIIIGSKKISAWQERTIPRWIPLSRAALVRDWAFPLCSVCIAGNCAQVQGLAIPSTTTLWTCYRHESSVRCRAPKCLWECWIWQTKRRNE